MVYSTWGVLLWIRFWGKPDRLVSRNRYHYIKQQLTNKLSHMVIDKPSQYSEGGLKRVIFCLSLVLLLLLMSCLVVLLLSLFFLSSLLVLLPSLSLSTFGVALVALVSLVLPRLHIVWLARRASRHITSRRLPSLEYKILPSSPFISAFHHLSILVLDLQNMYLKALFGQKWLFVGHTGRGGAGVHN